MNPVEEFFNITGYNISEYFSKFKSFVNTYYDNIIDYYEGEANIDKDAFKILAALQFESEIILDLFSINRDNLSIDTSFWDLLENFEDTVIKLQTIENTPIWSRSSFSNDYSNKIDIDYSLGQHETLERAARELGYKNFDTDYIELALRNKLKEKDYTEEGGVILRVSFENTVNVNILTTIDVFTGLNAMGKDYPNKFEIDEEEDFVILEPLPTSDQTSENLLGLVRGSIPERPEEGISNFIGQNRNFTKFPILFRQLSEVFKDDDTYKGLELINIEYEQDATRIDVRILTKITDINYEKSLII